MIETPMAEFATRPHAANAEKGQRVVAVVADRLAQFLYELSTARMDDDFPFASR